MNVIKIMIQFYMIAEPITAWFFILISIICTFTAFSMSRKRYQSEPRYDRLFLMSGIFAAIGLALLIHFFSRGSERAIELIKEAYKFPYIFKE